jgi:hypothetical protein
MGRAVHHGINRMNGLMNSWEKSHSEATSRSASQECYFLFFINISCKRPESTFTIFATYWFRIREKEMAVWPSRHVTNLISGLFRLKLSSILNVRL